AAREDLHDPLDLGLAADDRVELALGGEAGEIAAELVEQLRGLLALALTRALALTLAATARAREHADDLVADLFRVRVEIQKDVLGADVVVLEDASFLLGQDDHLAGAFCKALKHDLDLLFRGAGVPDESGGFFSVSARSPDGKRSLGSVGACALSLATGYRAK